MRIIKLLVLSMVLTGFCLSPACFADDQLQASLDEDVYTEDVDNDFCPVTGGAVDKCTPYRTEYNGKTIGFSSPDAIEEFDENPDKYLSNIWYTEET
ncbi:MAG: YHS domain-containing protein [Candidatus Omnitrophota bacterium]